MNSKAKVSSYRMYIVHIISSPRGTSANRGVARAGVVSTILGSGEFVFDERLWDRKASIVLNFGDDYQVKKS